ncbi:MAG TPA: LAGLIDADG family homing endonuclease [Candidatus Nanoarchaeia archaeon]|nr:LAGLIDADG family homing endonuclease [Candidatus Nanoarchaeia archaeon]
MEKRTVFPKGEQRRFLIESKRTLGTTWDAFSKELQVKRGTLEKSYAFELCRLPEKTFIDIMGLLEGNKEELLSEYKGRIVDFNPKEVIGRDCLGEMRAKLPKMGITYKKSPEGFDVSYITLNSWDKKKDIKFPEKLTPDLAEEIGISIGDGFLSGKRYEYRLKGSKQEKEYYDGFIKPLYKRLYNLDLNVREYETTYGFELSSEALWRFKKEVLGIQAGRKDNIPVPEIVKVNDQKILTAFIRGIFDTDGCVSFIKKYKNLGNYYPTITLSLKSKRAILDIKEILEMLGFDPKCYEWGGYWQIALNGYERFALYSKLMGWSNPVQKNKVINWKKKYPNLGKTVMVDVV